MAQTQPPTEEPASLADARRLDRLCDRFEAAWREGGRPSLEAFLAEAPAALRAEALRQLLVLDVEYRQGAGETPTVEDYWPRFGDCRAVLHKLLDARPPATPAQRAPGRLTGSAAATPAQGEGVSGPAPAIPGYEILGELGRGGMGIVYKARQVKAGRVVALKMILSGSHAGPELQARFRTEAEAVARLQHPNIVQVHEVGEHAGQPFFSLEFCPGGSLDKKLAGAPLPPPEAAALLEPLARAMHLAHQKGVVHRDLKPANVLLAENGAPKVTDFGLARKLDAAGWTLTGEVLGTPSYMAPEQASGRTRAIGPACDVYALGVILYECLTGRPPFKAATPLETLQQVCEQEPVAPRSLSPQVPHDLETVCLKCLEKEPHRRYASALALAEGLARFLAGEPVRAQPPSALRLAAHWIRLHPAAVSVLAGGAFLALFITLGAIWHSVQLGVALEGEQRERLKAKLHEKRARQNEAWADQLAYASDLRLANQLLQQGDIYRLSDLLDRQVPTAGAEERREFAWFYARRFGRPAPPPSLPGPGATMTAYSADGRVLAAGGRDAVVQLWEMPKGRLWKTAPAAARCAVLYPDGRTLAFVPKKQNRTIRLLDLATGKQRALQAEPAGSEVEHLILSADGKTLASASGDGVQLWEAESLRQRRRFAEPGGCVALALSPGGRQLVTAARKAPHRLRLHDVATGALCAELTLGPQVFSLTYSRQGGLLAAGLRGGPVVLLRAAGDRLIVTHYLGSHGAPVAAFAPDGRSLAAAADSAVQIWDTRDGTLRSRLRWQAAPVSALAFSPDGQTLAVGTNNGLVHRVSPDCPPSHEILRAELRPAGPLAVAHDGKTVAVPDEDHTVKLVNLAGGQVRLTLPGHGGRLSACVFSPDDRTLATAGIYDPEVRLWDTETGQPRKTLRAGLAGVRCLAYSSRGGLLAAGDDGGVVWVWEPAAGALRGKLPCGGSQVRDLAFSADGRTLAGCDGSVVVRVWDIPNQGTLAVSPRTEDKLPDGAVALAFAPGGRTLAVGDAAGGVRLFSVPDAGPLRPVGRPVARDTEAPVLNLAFSPDGATLLMSRRVDHFHYVDLWDVPAGALRKSLRRDLFPGRHTAAWLPDGRVLVQARGGDVHIEDLATRSVRVLPRQALWGVASLAYSPDGRFLYLGTMDPLGDIRSHRPILLEARCKGDVADSVRIWDVERHKAGPRLQGEMGLALPALIALSADGRLLAGGAVDGSIRVWDLSGQRVARQLFVSKRARDYANRMERFSAVLPCKPEYRQHSEEVKALAFSPNRRWLAAVGERGSVTLWDTDTWQEHGTVPSPQVGAGWAGFSPDSLLAVACKGQVRLYDPRNGEVQTVLGTPDDAPIVCGAFSPSGHLLATGTVVQTLRVWDMRAAREKRVLSGHMNQVSAVGFSPDGKTLATGDWSGVVKLWSVASLREVGSLTDHTGKVCCLAFSPDGQTLATGAEVVGGQGEVFLWRAPRP